MGSSIADLRKAFFGTTDAELAALQAAVDAGQTFSGMASVTRRRYKSGYYYAIPSNVATGIRSEATLEVGAFDVYNTIEIDRIAVEVTVAGTAGALFRLGIYDEGEDGLPNSLVLDAGTVNCESTGVKEVALLENVTLEPGRYWLGGATQGAAGTRPTLRCYSGIPTLSAIGAQFATTIIPFATVGYSLSGVTGEFPSVFGSPTGANATVPRLAVRVA